MQTVKIFINGRSQAVRLPKDFRFSVNDVFIKKIGNMVVLFPKDDPWSSWIDSLDQFTDDFMDSRDQPDQDTREKFFRKKSTPIDALDMLIAAHALYIPSTLVTNNVKKFIRIPNLKVENGVK